MLAEFLFDLIFDVVYEASKSKKISKWIRYPAIVLISLFYLAVVSFCIAVGVMIIVKEKNNSLIFEGKNDSLLVGSFMILIGVFFITCIIIKFVKYIHKNKKNGSRH